MTDNTIFEGAVSIVDNIDPVNNGYGDLTATRLVRAPSLLIPAGANEVTLRSDPGLATDWTFNFPANPPSAVDCQTIVTTGGTNTFYEIHPKFEVFVRQNPGPGEFSSVGAALASIPLIGPEAPSQMTPWVVYVNPGVYFELPIVVPASYITIMGITNSSVLLIQILPGSPFITCVSNTTINNLALIGGVEPNYPAILCSNVLFTTLNNLQIIGFSQGVLASCDALAVGNTIVLFNFIDIYSCVEFGIKFIDTNLLGGFGAFSAINTMTVAFGHRNNAIIIDGLNTRVKAQNLSSENDGSGTAILIQNGAAFNITNSYFGFYGIAIDIPNDGTSSVLQMSSTTFFHCVQNLNILNPLCGGFYSGGFTEYTKTLIPKDAPFFIYGEDQQIITVYKKGGNFTSIVAALAAITDNSPTVRYVISVGPGIFTETQIVLKPYVTIAGILPSSTILQADPSIAGTPFIVGSPYGSITKMTVRCADNLFPPSYLIEYLGDPTGSNFRCDFIVVDSSLDLFHIGSTAGPCIFLAGTVLINMSAPFRRGFYIEDSGAFNFPITFSIDNIIWGADAMGVSNLTEVVNITSFKSPAPQQNIFGAITNSSMGTNFFGPVGTGFYISGAVYAIIETCIFGGLVTGVEVAASAEPTFLILSTSTIANNTNDIIIDSATAFGSINVSATLSKVTINPSANFGIQINDPTGGIAFSGDMYQGTKWDELTNISEQIQHASTCGIIDGQTPLIDAGGLNISIGAGTGYVFFGPPAANHLKYVIWAANPAFALPDNALSWLYVDSGGVIGYTPTDPDPIANIILGAVKTYGGSITYIQEAGHVLNNLSSNIDDILRDTWGPVVRSGCLASPGSAVGERAVQVSSGFYSLGVSQYPPTGGDNVSMIGYYGGSVETAPFTNIPLQWDNAGVLTAIGAGKWVKHSVYILSSLTGSVQYFFVYGQTEFNSELDAQVGSIPTAPPTFTANMCPVAGVIVTDTDPSSPLAASRFRDIRPTLGFRSEGSTASADHNSLLNLTVGNAHPQYFRVDGTSIMTGSVNLGTQNIIGVGGNLLNGVDLSAHASRHLPGGADALTTGTPVGVGSANAAGTAAAFSRSDHVHAGVSSLAGTANQISASASLGAITLSTPASFIAPGTIKDTTGMYNSTTVGIISSGATQGTATTLTTSFNIISTVAAGTGVILQTPAQSGLIVTIVNRGANAVFVYPNVGGTIDAAAVNTPVSLASGSSATYQASSTLQWYTMNPQIISGTGISVSYSSGSTQVSNAGVLSVKADAGAAEVGALTLASGTNMSIVDSPAGTFTFNVPTGAGGVTTWSGGTTGLTPAGATSGAITLGGTLIAANGGTGISSYTIGDLLYASSTTTLSKLLAANAGNALISNGVGVAPLWGKIDLTTTISGVLQVANGGTNISSYTTGDLLYASGVGTLSKLSDVAIGSALISGGVGVAPSWGKIGLGTHVSGVLPVANGGTNSSTTLNNNRIMVSSSGSIVEASALTNGQLLIGSTGAAPVPATLTAGTGITILNGAGSITISSSGMNPIILSATTSQISVGNGAATIVGFIPWSHTDFGGFTTRTITAWVIPSASATKNLTISVLPDGGASIGSLVIPGGAAIGALYTFTITNPGVDTNLQFQVSRTGASSQNPIINGITLKLT